MSKTCEFCGKILMEANAGDYYDNKSHMANCILDEIRKTPTTAENYKKIRDLNRRWEIRFYWTFGLGTNHA